MNVTVKDKYRIIIGDDSEEKTKQKVSQLEKFTHMRSRDPRVDFNTTRNTWWPR
jgi:hypothetical protein